MSKGAGTTRKSTSSAPKGISGGGVTMKDIYSYLDRRSNISTVSSITEVQSKGANDTRIVNVLGKDNNGATVNMQLKVDAKTKKITRNK